MAIDKFTKDEEVPEFLSCGHNAHWQIWHSLAQGEPCILCRAEKAEREVDRLNHEVSRLTIQLAAMTMGLEVISKGLKAGESAGIAVSALAEAGVAGMGFKPAPGSDPGWPQGMPKPLPEFHPKTTPYDTSGSRGEPLNPA
jgi:hypothetical protein